MIASMTGFGSGRSTSPQMEIEVTVKSLNGRFLEVRCHLPREYAAFELELKKLAAKELHRGTVDIYVQRRPKGLAGSEIHMDVAGAKQWLKAYARLGKELSLKAEPTLAQVIEQPDILQWQAKGGDSKEKGSLMKAATFAVQKCNQERLREGRAIKAHLNELFDGLNREVTKIEKLMVETKSELGRRLEQRMAASPFGERVDAQRLAQELAMYLDRADIAEEVQRLKEHLKMARELMESDQIPGKKLDFYTQELHREVNTIGSKSPIPALTHSVVEAKSLIEQLKEQVQNIV